jgi:hypothetical protein
MNKIYCKLTGADLTEDGAANGFKCMCVNCKSCICDTDKGYLCKNDKVMEVGRQKILASVPEGFEVDTLTLKPMVLKDPTKKCKNHQFDLDAVVEYISDYFTASPYSEKENASE